MFHSQYVYAIFQEIKGNDTISMKWYYLPDNELVFEGSYIMDSPDYIIWYDTELYTYADISGNKDWWTQHQGSWSVDVCVNDNVKDSVAFTYRVLSSSSSNVSKDGVPTKPLKHIINVSSGGTD